MLTSIARKRSAVVAAARRWIINKKPPLSPPTRTSIILPAASSSRSGISTMVSVAPPIDKTGTGGQLLSDLTADLPHLDVVRYHHKNRVWSLQHVEYYSEALAIGLLENGLVEGDVVLSWLPPYFQEQMVLQFACSKSGLILYTLDPTVSDTNALAKALELTQANVLISQEAGQDTNYINLVQHLIPELRIFDYSLGMPFMTPRFPHLRLCVQTGYDQEDKEGWLRFRHMIVPSHNLDEHLSGPLSAKTPLCGVLELDASGMVTGVGKPLTNEQVIQQGVWPTYSAILKKEYHEVEGVGVIF